MTTRAVAPRLASWCCLLALVSAGLHGSQAAAAPGRVLLVLGSDTAIWNDGTTVDVYSRHPYYPPDFYTDPASPSFQVMDPRWRSQFKDSFGQPLKFTWWMMGGNIYRDASNLNVPVPNTMVLHLMKEYHGAALREFGDEVSLHYHTFIWSDYNGDGKYFWNQSQTFAECRADFDLTLAQYLTEEEVFPVSFRSGWHYMDNEWQQYLDQLLPFSLHNNWPAYRAWYTNEPINNVQDWSRATSQFVPFHPAPNDYQVAGTGRGWEVRSIKMQAMLASDMESLFAAASNGVDQVACIWDHLPENFLPNVARIASLAEAAAANHPGVTFRYCTAVEAMQRWLGLEDTNPPQIEVTESTTGQAITLRIHTSEPLFQPRPFVALRDVFGHYADLTGICQSAGSNTWAVALPVPRDQVAKVGIAATDLAGNVSTRLLRYSPDDVYLDNRDPAYAEVQGGWMSTTNAAWGTDARIARVGSNDAAQVRWSLPVAYSGRYQLAIQVPPLTNSAAHATFYAYSGSSNVLTLRFPIALPARQWVVLGSPYLDVSLSNSLEMVVSGSGQPDSVAVADVVRIAPSPEAVLASTPPPGQMAVVATFQGFKIRYTGQPGQVYQVERSSDLHSWTILSTLVAPADGPMEYDDMNPPSAGAYYRVAPHL